MPCRDTSPHSLSRLFPHTSGRDKARSCNAVTNLYPTRLQAFACKRLRNQLLITLQSAPLCRASSTFLRSDLPVPAPRLSARCGRHGGRCPYGNNASKTKGENVKTVQNGNISPFSHHLCALSPHCCQPSWLTLPRIYLPTTYQPGHLSTQNHNKLTTNHYANQNNFRLSVGKPRHECRQHLREYKF